jgi:4-oxalocrotonate tautomerase
MGGLAFAGRPSIFMPYINLQITKGATRDQKAQIVAEFTGTLVRVLGKKPEHTHIVIEEIDDENWGYAGMLTDDFRRQQLS